MLNGFQQLTVDLEDVDAGAGQLDFGRVLTRNGLVANFPGTSDDLVFGQVSVTDISAGRVAFLASRFQLHLFERQLFQSQNKRGKMLLKSN